ncbi:hypothetical protein [Paremcibacter congregatus]|uniref:hypothetical protein n=1 Tax=Paremcibacter congregatus TaxID=2043170 RepID=UPI003A9245D7
MPQVMDPEEHMDSPSDQPNGPERRITFQLYEYWFGLVEEGGLPPLKSLTPADIAPYRNNMVLIDLRDPESEPTLQVVGQLLLDDVGEDIPLSTISDIPRRTLLSRLTDHYMEVLGNKSPISFDAEFINLGDQKIYYRGIMLPFSDDGIKVNFILGAIRWISEDDMKKAAAEAALYEQDNTTQSTTETDTPAEATASLAPAAPTEEGSPTAADNISAPDIPVDVSPSDQIPASLPHLREELEKCRSLVQGQSPADLRSRKALYETLGAVLDFHHLCQNNIDSYRQLLAEEDLRAQKRAPFTPALKLCFGRDYDKTRLTEYAATLSYAQKHNLTGVDLPEFLENFPGGIKGCVQAERQGRHDGNNTPTALSDEESKKIIQNMPPLASFDVLIDDDTGNEEGNDLCLVLTRREGTRMDVVKILPQDKKILGPIIKKLIRDL